MARRLARWWRSKPLRVRLTLLMVAVFVVVSSTASLITVVALRVEYSTSVDSQISTLAKGVVDATAFDKQRLPAGRWLLEADSLYVGRFHDSYRSTGAEPELPDPLPTKPFYATVYSADGTIGPYRVYGEPAPDGQTVVVATSLAGLKHAGSVVGAIITLEALAAIGVMALVGSYLIRRELRPLDQVADQADALAATDVVLPDRLDVPEYPRSTEIGRMVGALDGMLTELRGALAERDASAARLRQFAADASHELRTPLQSIRGYAELRTAGVMGDGEVDDAMGRIAAEVARMTGLVEALLALARFDAELDQDGYRVPVDLSALVGQACRDAAAVQPDRPLRVVVPPGIEVAGDPDQLEQLLANLMGNVRMHTTPDTPVEVTLSPDGGDAVLTVRDHGPGIPEEALPHVFDRFYRVDKGRSRAAGGSGLGLAIVAATVAAHQGTVTTAAPSGGGAGLEVTVRLPLVGGEA
ncbi:MAG TPA: ATP-binding protein [Actinospica sp.]|nr:ATP-binding protein [Actinospica sp.]